PPRSATGQVARKQTAAPPGANGARVPGPRAAPIARHRTGASRRDKALTGDRGWKPWMPCQGAWEGSVPVQIRLKTSDPLVPPKPKLFFRATSIFMLRAVLAQ